MSAGRSLVVDTLPIEKQQTGSAWGMSFFEKPSVVPANIAGRK